MDLPKRICENCEFFDDDRRNNSSGSCAIDSNTTEEPKVVKKTDTCEHFLGVDFW